MVKTYLYRFVAPLLVLGVALTNHSCSKDDELTGFDIPAGYYTAADSIGLNATSWSMEVDDTFTIKAEVYPGEVYDSSVNYSSSDSGVATISDSGEVTAIALGEAIITVSSNQTPTTTAEVKISVVENVVELERIEITGIGVVSGAATVAVADTLLLSVTYYPADATNRDIEWTQSHGEYASVGKNTGLVRGKAVGDCTITAVSVGNSDITAICDISVQYIELESLDIFYLDTLQTKHYQMTIGILDSVNIALGYERTPYNGTITTTNWISSDEKVATVDEDGVITAVGVGSATISLTCENIYGISEPFSVKNVTSNTFRVDVEKIVADSFTLSSRYTSTRPNESFAEDIRLTTYPSYATAGDLVWSISSMDGLVMGTDIKVTESRDIWDQVTAKVESISDNTGEFTLTASYVDSVEVSASINLYVEAATNVNIDPQFHGAAFPITDGSTQLSWTYFPTGSGTGNYDEPTITWTSSDEDIATVDSSGKVTFAGYGQSLSLDSKHFGDVTIMAESSYDGTIESVDITIPAGYWRELYNEDKSLGSSNGTNYGWNYYLFNHSSNTSHWDSEPGYITIYSSTSYSYEENNGSRNGYPDSDNDNIFYDAARRSDVWCFDERITLLNGKTYPYLVFHLDDVFAKGLGNVKWQTFGLSISASAGTVSNFTISSYVGYADSRTEVRYLSDNTMLIIYNLKATGNSLVYTNLEESPTSYLEPSSISLNYFQYGYGESSTDSDGNVVSALESFYWSIYSVQTFATQEDIDNYITELALSDR